MKKVLLAFVAIAMLGSRCSVEVSYPQITQIILSV